MRTIRTELVLLSCAILLGFACKPKEEAKTPENTKEETSEVAKGPSGGDSPAAGGATTTQPSSADPRPDSAIAFMPVENCDKTSGTVLVAAADQEIIIPEKACVLINESLSIDAGMTVKAGATLLFANNTALRVSETGFLELQGRADAPVLLAGQVATQGWWVGLVIESNHPKNVLEYAIVEHSGSDTHYTTFAAALALGESAQASVRNCSLRQGKGHGVTIAAGTKVNAFVGNVFEGFEEAPLRLTAALVASIDASNRFAGSVEQPNKKPYVLLDGGTLKDAATWPTLDVPYRVSQVIGVEGLLTLSAGTRMEFESEAALYVTEGGLIAKGSADAKIVFTQSPSQQNQWYGVIIQSSNPSNQLEHVLVEQAGRGTYYTNQAANLVLGPEAVASLTDVELRAGKGYCISMEPGSKLKAVRNVLLEGCELGLGRVTQQHLGSLSKHSFVGAPQEMAGPSLAQPEPVPAEPAPEADAAAEEGAEPAVAEVAQEAPALPAGKHWIEVEAGYLTEPATWPGLGIPLRFDAWAQIESALVIEAGLELRFAPGSGMNVLNNGSIDARGTAEAPVRMVALDASSPAWAGLRVATKSDSNRLVHTQLSRGGGNGEEDAANLSLESEASISVQNCRFEHSARWGIAAAASATLSPAEPSTEAENQFADNASGDFVRGE